MEITYELLGAFAEGKVTEEEKEAVRKYLVEHPNELETVAIMMDEDYDLTDEKKEQANSWMMAPPTTDADPVNAAFTPFALDDATEPKTFDQRLDELLDEVFLGL